MVGFKGFRENVRLSAPSLRGFASFQLPLSRLSEPGPAGLVKEQMMLMYAQSPLVYNLTGKSFLFLTISVFGIDSSGIIQDLVHK